MLFWSVVQIVTGSWKRSALTTCRIACWTPCATTAPTTPQPNASCSPVLSACCRSCVPSAASVSTDCVASSTRASPSSRPPSPRPHRRWLPPHWPALAWRSSRRSRRPEERLIATYCRLGHYCSASSSLRVLCPSRAWLFFVSTHTVPLSVVGAPPVLSLQAAGSCTPDVDVSWPFCYRWGQIVALGRI